MKPRTTERFPHRFRVLFSGIEAAIEGEGTITDLSKGGCRIESETCPPKGAELKIELSLSDYFWPMKVDRAVVRWTKGRTFGVEFVTLQSAQRDRLVRVVMKLKQDAGH